MRGAIVCVAGNVGSMNDEDYHILDAYCSMQCWVYDQEHYEVFYFVEEHSFQCVLLALVGVVSRRGCKAVELSG